MGIELNPYAVFDAEVNKELNGITNLTVLQGDVAEILSKVPPSFAADLMIVDPPRAGLGDKAIDQVLHFQPQEILYVSCNPFTQKEDIQKLVLKGYQVAAIQPVDQFAHSFHLENLALLKRKI
ncbi:MAG: hypothetical protein FJZ63_01895 [Chlamydiae bacterium]|nr:hypothetical protein [Chlamydiota bacterium]